MCSSREESKQLPSHANMYDDNDDVETDGRNRKIHYRGNSKKAGYIVYTVSTYVAVYVATHITYIQWIINYI